jgi:hypothetical protein
MIDLTRHQIRAVPAYLRRTESGALILTIDGAATLLATDDARRLAEMLIEIAEIADCRAAALSAPEAKAFDAANGQPLGHA